MSLTLFQMRTGVGIPMTSQLRYTWAPVTFQMSLGDVTMEGPTREGTKPNIVFNIREHVRKYRLDYVYEATLSELLEARFKDQAGSPPATSMLLILPWECIPLDKNKNN